jgi:hypothetical protein
VIAFNPTNSATVVDDAMGFVSDSSKENLKPSSSSSNEDDEEESNEPDYDEDEELEKQQNEFGGIAQTTNQVF